MIIFDEKIYAEEVLRKGFKTKNKNVYELNIVCKYLLSLGWDEGKVKKRIIKLCEKYIDGFSIEEWYKVINTTLSSAKRGTLKTGKEVHITQSELDVIQSIDGIREQKVAFTLLVLYKFYNYNKFTVQLIDLFTLSELTTIDTKTRLKILHKLTQSKLIDIDMRGRRWVKFVDKDNEPVIVIKNFDNFIWEYLHFIGEGKFKRCMECHSVIKITTGNNLYCKRCSKEVNRIKTLTKYHQKMNFEAKNLSNP